MQIVKSVTIRPDGVIPSLTIVTSEVDEKGREKGVDVTQPLYNTVKTIATYATAILQYAQQQVYNPASDYEEAGKILHGEES